MLSLLTVADGRWPFYTWGQIAAVELLPDYNSEKTVYTNVSPGVSEGIFRCEAFRMHPEALKSLPIWKNAC